MWGYKDEVVGRVGSATPHLGLPLPGFGHARVFSGLCGHVKSKPGDFGCTKMISEAYTALATTHSPAEAR